MLHKALQNKWTRVAIAVVATLLYAVGVNLFIVPVGLYSGGVVGLSQVIRTLLARSVALPENVDIAGILYFLLNVPVLIMAWKELGRGFLIRTLICVGASSFFLSVIKAPASPLLEDPLSACVVGGILCGFALGLALTCGCSTGGLDVVGLCLSKRGSRFTVGRFSLSFNVALYAACAILFNIQTAIYSVIYTVFCSLFIDRGHQQNISVQVLIFTKDEDPQLPSNIMTRLGRGVTYWEGKGAYTGSDLRVLCVCVSKFEVAELQETVRELDPRAFFIVQEGVRIGGNFARKIS
ncbi:MAG: YitT family protein [Oscillospiraceae bacterium]|nr:YitT family protein [Oscillospiraceae bacterium]